MMQDFANISEIGNQLLSKEKLNFAKSAVASRYIKSEKKIGALIFLFFDLHTT